MSSQGGLDLTTTKGLLFWLSRILGGLAKICTTRLSKLNILARQRVFIFGLTRKPCAKIAQGRVV